jgi:hypothetical protein
MDRPFLTRRWSDLHSWHADLLSEHATIDEKEDVQMSEQPRKVKNEAIPDWADGLYYNMGLFSEVLGYHDDEAIYFEHLGKEKSVVRFTFEMIESRNSFEEVGSADSQE